MAIEVPAVAGKIINLGRAGENLATTVVFDVSSWIEEFGANGTFDLFVQQGTNEYYLQTVTGPLNGKVKWNITNNNTAIVGLGKCELSYTKTSDQNNIVVKSMIYDIMVTNALDIGEEGEMPDPIQSWINDANAVLAEVQDTADWVVGPGGTPVEPSSTNNAQYYMGQASDFADAANSAKNDAVSAKNTAVSAKNDAVSAKTAAETAENNIKSLNGTQTVTTTNAGANASVTLNTSTTPYKFEFTLPKGSQWFTGTGNPTTISGAKINDYYLNTTNGQIWKCTNNNSSSWSSIGNIKGTPGDNAPEITNISINQSNYHMTVTLSDGTSYDAGYCRGEAGQDGTGAGTVTSVGISNATNGGLSVSGSPISSSGTVTIGHSNVLTSAQTTQNVYPITIDKNGHISTYGSAVTIPSPADATPSMNGNAAVGTSTDYAREDHVHPTDTSRAASSHSHGNITNSGDITATAPTIASGDQIIINDNSASKITNGPTFDGSTTTKYLSQKGTWESVPSVPSPADATPLVDGTAAVGTSTDYAREDHVHPTDTTRQVKITASGILKGNGSGTVNAATAGTDYIAPPSSPSNGNVLTYNGSAWVAQAPATGLPDMTGNSGKYLYTDGQAADWVEIDALPSQSSSTNGWVLTSVYNSSTSTSNAEWQVLSGVTGQLSTPAIRNIYAGTAELTSSDTLPEGTIYLVYEA